MADISENIHDDVLFEILKYTDNAPLRMLGLTCKRLNSITKNFALRHGVRFVFDSPQDRRSIVLFHRQWKVNKIRLIDNASKIGWNGNSHFHSVSKLRQKICRLLLSHKINLVEVSNLHVISHNLRNIQHRSSLRKACTSTIEET